MGKVPLLDDIDMKQYSFWEDVVSLLENYDPSVLMWDRDTRFDGENDEEYEYRNHPKEGESITEFTARALER